MVDVDRLADEVRGRVDSPWLDQLTACCSSAGRLAPMSQVANSITLP